MDNTYLVNHEPDAVLTEDGYTFRRQPDGSYSDGDMSWPSWNSFVETCDVDWVPVTIDKATTKPI